MADIAAFPGSRHGAGPRYLAAVVRDIAAYTLGDLRRFAGQSVLSVASWCNLPLFGFKAGEKMAQALQLDA
jgi:hypothetical protein